MVWPPSFLLCLAWADRRLPIASCLPVMCLSMKEDRWILCPWQDRNSLMGPYTLHILLKPSFELNKHIKAYIINSNFSWTMFVLSQVAMAEVRSFFHGKHCHYRGLQGETGAQTHRRSWGWRRLNTNCFQERRWRQREKRGRLWVSIPDANTDFRI